LTHKDSPPIVFLEESVSYHLKRGGIKMRARKKALAVMVVTIMSILFLAFGASSEEPGAAPSMAIKVDKSKTALLVMDLQKHMIDPQSPLAQHTGFAEMVKKTDMLPRVRKVIDAARSAGMPVIWIRVDFSAGRYPRYPTRGGFCKNIAAEYEGGKVLRPGAWGYEIAEEVAPQKGDMVIGKRHMSAFAGSNLHEVLEAKGITDIALTGVATSYVVTATSWDALLYGYSNIVIEDCCTTHNEKAQEAAINTLRAIADVCAAEKFINAIK
jgi:nicotinamidase-related amidase